MMRAGRKLIDRAAGQEVRDISVGWRWGFNPLLFFFGGPGLEHPVSVDLHGRLTRHSVAK